MPEKSPKKRLNSITKKIIQDNENGARQAIIEDLFFDFHRSRRQVYWMNFWRGLFFGIDSVVGVTIFVVLSVWILSKTADIFPAMADFINTLVDTMQRRR